jgi:hypothetical protein
MEWKKFDLRVNLWNSGDGLIRANRTFIDSDPEEIFFEDWQ